MYDDLQFEPLRDALEQPWGATTPSDGFLNAPDLLPGVDPSLELIADQFGAKSDWGPQATQDPPVTDVGEVVVYGGQYSRLVGWQSSNGPMDGGWDGNDSEQYVFVPDWGCTGAPDGTAPDDHTAVRVRLIAQELAARLDSPDLNSSWEWGALIYQTADGWLHTTDIFSIRQPGVISFPYGDSGYLPDGAMIVGWVHSHPFVYGDPPQSGLSGWDANAFETMTQAAANQGNRFSVSPTLMTYVFDRSGDKLFEFGEDDDEFDLGQWVKECG